MVVTLPSCAVPVSVTKLSSQAFMWFSSHLSYPLPSVWLGWPWSPKSRSSPLKIRLLISPPVECVMPLHGYLLSHITLLVTTTCLLLSKTWIKCITVSQNVADQFLIHCLALAWAWLNVRASILASVSVLVTKTRYDEANHFDEVNIHPDPATKCSIMLS